jgi:cation diffusion facilitator family transporter
MALSASRKSLTRYAWLSVAAALATISLKAGAYFVTGSVGLLSDALESVVNLIAALLALAMITVAARPPDDDHAYGHDKAEYFSSGVEGGLILLAALSISYAAFTRLLNPQPIEQAGLGLIISIAASVINLIVARILLQAGRHYRSISLEADAHHLMTDVWTSAGVVVGVAAAALTGWQRLDPLIALIVAANIVWSGVRLIQRSVLGLLDTALPIEERRRISALLDRYAHEQGFTYHALRTRQAGARRFVSVHILVPGNWSVTRGHSLLEQIETQIRTEMPHTSVFTHLEPIEDPRSFADQYLDRSEEA